MTVGARYFRRVTFAPGVYDDRHALSILPMGFTAVDVQLTGGLAYAEAGGCLEGRDGLQRYLNTMKQRPSAQAVKAF